jgi:addiction module HigA family antidote
MSDEILAPIHPGEILDTEYLKPLNITSYQLAQKLGVPHSDVDNLCRGKSSVSPSMAVGLGKFFGTSVEFWLNLQKQYDVRKGIEK